MHCAPGAASGDVFGPEIIVGEALAELGTERQKLGRDGDFWLFGNGRTASIRLGTRFVSVGLIIGHAAYDPLIGPETIEHLGQHFVEADESDIVIVGGHDRVGRSKGNWLGLGRRRFVDRCRFLGRVDRLRSNRLV